MTLILWLVMWIAGQQGPSPQPPAVSSESRFLCTEPAVPARDAKGAYLGPVCATLDGVVVRAGSNNPIANAELTLELPGSGANAEVLKTVADSAGRFRFPPINPMTSPNGYNLTAEVDGYLRAVYGRVGNNEAGELINFPGQQKHRTLTIQLNPYPSASGSVRTLDYQPIAAALVRAYRIQYTPIARRLKITRTTLTNDLGDFRFAWIDPADYYVSASYSGAAREFPIAGTRLTPNLSNPDSGFVTAFYPATTSSADAIAFTVVPTGEKSNLNIALKDSDRFRIRVHVFSGTNSLPHAFNVALMPAGSDLGDAPDYAVKGNGGADFDIPDVGPGRYSLVAFDKSRILSDAIPITVDHDLDNVKIPVYDPLDIPGVVVDEYGSPIPGKLKFRLVRTDPELGQTIQGDVDSGSFLVPAVGPGAYDVYIDGLPRSLYIKEVRFPVNDNLFGRIRIEPDKPERVLDATTQQWKSKAVVQVVVALTDAAVEGTVWTGAKTADGPVGVPGAQVVLVPDRGPDNPYGQREDRFITGNADTQGRFHVIVPPGAYTAFGFVEIQPGLYYDPEFNARIADLGLKVIVNVGQTVKMTFCQTFDAVPKLCLLRVPREQSIGVSP